MTKPFLKWAGGKRKLAPLICPQIADYLDTTGGTYFEPFLGAGAVALHLDRHSMVLSDAITDLMKLWQQVKSEPESLHKAVQVLRDAGTDEQSFYQIREAAFTSSEMIAARALYLNRLCHSGLWRVNAKGKFNTPYGNYKSPRWPTLEDLENAADSLSGAQVYCGDFQVAVNIADKGDFVYADPPYHDPENKAFVAYTKDKFDSTDQIRLAASLERAWRRGAAILHSNSDTELIRTLYSWANVKRLDEDRAINSDPEGRGKAKCLLITAN